MLQVFQKFPVVGHKLVIEDVERFFEAVIGVSTPMDGLLIDCKVNEVFNVLKDEGLACLLVIGYELLNNTGAFHFIVNFVFHLCRKLVQLEAVLHGP
jgi:hypothetical protein